jgi:REP element-mobilizing transposase RayT
LLCTRGVNCTGGVRPVALQGARMASSRPLPPMARAPRREQQDAWYHVTARGVDRRRIFQDAVDRRFFLTMLDEVRDRHGWSCLSYCLMENHYHLLIRTRDPTLAAGMQRLNGRYAQRFNWRHERSGHLLELPYAKPSRFSIPIWSLPGARIARLWTANAIPRRYNRSQPASLSPGARRWRSSWSVTGRARAPHARIGSSDTP